MKKAYITPQTICIELEADIMLHTGSQAPMNLYYDDDEYADDSEVL